MSKWMPEEAIIVSGDLKFRKPDQRIFQLMEERLELNGTQLLYVGDSFDLDVAGSTEAGWSAVWFNRRKRSVPPSGTDLSFTEVPSEDMLLRYPWRDVEGAQLIPLMAGFPVRNDADGGAAVQRIKQILHHGRETDTVLQIHIEPLKRQCLFIRHIDVIIAQHHAHAIDIELLHRHFAGLRIHKAIIAVSAKRQKEFLHGQIIPLPAEFPIGTEEWLCHIIECVIDIKYYTAYIHNILIPYT